MKHQHSEKLLKEWFLELFTQEEVIKQIRRLIAGDKILNIFNLFCLLDPIDCSDLNICHLAWLIRDERLRLENNNIIDGTCSDGTSFEMVSFTRFNNC